MSGLKQLIRDVGMNKQKIRETIYAINNGEYWIEILDKDSPMIGTIDKSIDPHTRYLEIKIDWMYIM